MVSQDTFGHEPARMAAFRDRLATRIAFAASALVLFFVLLVGLGTWVFTAGLLRDQVQLLLHGQATLAADRGSRLVAAVDERFQALAPLVGSAETLAAIGGSAEIEGLPVQTLLADAAGKIRTDAAVDEADAWLLQVIAAGLPRGRLRDAPDGPALEAVLPLRTITGAVIWRLPLRALLDHLARRSDNTRMTLGNGRLGVAEPAAEAADALTVSAPVILPGLFGDTALRLDVAAEPILLQTPLKRLTALFLAIGALTPLLVVAAAMVMGRHLSAGLTRLADAAASFAFGKGDRNAFHSPGQDEVARLGAAFAGTVERLDRAYQEMERRGQTLLSNTERVARIGSATWDPVGEHQVWSEQFYAVLGLDPAADIAGRTAFFNRVHPGDRRRLTDSLADERGHVVEDFRLIRPDGTVRVAQLRAELARDADGTPLRIDVTIQDISERKRLEERLDALVGELKRSNEELEQFAYVASHDLRQPLRTVRSYVSLIEENLDGKLDGETLEFMDFIRDGVRRMDALITDLLAYSRVGRIGHEGAVDTGRAVGLALLDLQSQIDEAGADIVIPPHMPVVTGEAGEMARLFQNLIGNAVKYRAPDRPPRVEIGFSDHGSDWEFFVRDNGIGIPDEHAERIFGIFQRLHARHEYEGTGIGLAICRKIIERRGGHIWACVRDGPGAEFRFTWPKMPGTATTMD
jgi:PAS domain S-box-containing protein